MNNILIIGLGAIGGYIGSKYIINGDNVFFLVKSGSYKFQECLLEENGLSNLIKNIKYIKKEKLGIYKFDFIIVCVKAVDTDDVINILINYNVDISTVLFIQNGLHVLEEKYGYIPGIIFCNIIKKQNLIKNLGGIPRLLIKINNISSNMKKYLDNVISLNELNDVAFYCELYNKFIHIVVISSLTSLYEIPIKNIKKTERYRSAYTLLLNELILFFNNYKGIQLNKIDIITYLQNSPGDSYSSLYYDLMNNKRGEYDSLLGYIYGIIDPEDYPYISEIHLAMLYKYPFLSLRG